MCVDYSKDSMTNDEKQCCKNLGEACECKNQGCGEGCGGCGEEAGCAQCAEYKSGWQRALADYENLKKEMAVLRTKSRDQERESILKEFLAVMDVIDQSLFHRPDTSGLDDATKKKIDGWIRGVEFIKNQAEVLMERNGMGRIEGSTFDPNIHDAVATEHHVDMVDGAIVSIKQVGWRMGEKVLRPAVVVVNEKPEEES